VLVNDCVECQCTTEGTTCQRRPDCGRDVCVAVDGVEIPVASAARVAGCHDCTCRVAADGEPTLACVRAVDGDCPTDGCATPLIPFLAVGAEEFTSECHRCVCDADAGMRCENVCHPSCPCGVDGLFSSGCDALCDDDGCEATIARGVTAVAVPTMARVSRRGLDCVCDYSEIVCLEPASRPSP
jgi:hypothetical protein